MAKFKLISKKAKEKINFFTSEEELKIRKLKEAHIEMFSNRELSLEGCSGVIDYSENYIKLKLKKGTLILNGNCFYIAVFENETITVKGKIESVEFCV